MIKMGAYEDEIVEKYLRKARIGIYSYSEIKSLLDKKGYPYTIKELKEKANQL